MKSSQSVRKLLPRNWPDSESDSVTWWRLTLPNRAELLIPIMAARRIGAAATPINPMFHRERSGLPDRGLRGRVGHHRYSPMRPRVAVRCWSSTIWRQCRRPIPDPESMLQQTIWRCSSYTSGSTGRPKE
ncbi:unnamed protein product, partial [Mesorhabditis spiculigera]